jgi:hypothetical protein
MLELIERLEKATGADDKLNRDIASACGITWSSDEDGNFGGYNIAPRRINFTGSIDAALTLVPEGWDATINTFCWVELHDRAMKHESIHYRHAKQPIIALCIAALKVRTAITGGKGSET